MTKNRKTKPVSPTDWIDSLDADVFAARSVELIPPLPEGAVFLAALLDWKQFP